MNGKKVIFSTVYILFGAYLINSVLSFYPLPDLIPNLDKFVMVISGGLLIVAAFYFFKLKDY